MCVCVCVCVYIYTYRLRKTHIPPTGVRREFYMCVCVCELFNHWCERGYSIL